MKKEGIYGFQGEYRWLSNMWSCEVEFDGKMFPSSEHAYVYSKLTDDDQEKLYDELIAMEPRKSKTWGRKQELRENWGDQKLLYMNAIILNKFESNDNLREKLIDTGDIHIEETNDWGDAFWGVCDGIGKNHLGCILMATRNYLKMCYYGGI